MIWAIGLGLVLFVAGLREFMDEDGIVGKFMGFIMAGLIGCLAFMVGAGIGLGIGTQLPKEWRHTAHVELASLRNTEGIGESTLFLGTGHIGTSEYYFFYQKTDKGYVPGKLEVGTNVLVMEEDREDGVLNQFTNQFTNDWYNWVGISFGGVRSEFHIPKGSLKKNFVLQ